MSSSNQPDTEVASGRSLADRNWIYPVLLTVACALVYGRLAGFGFINIDDQVHLSNNPYVNPPSWMGLAHLWRYAYKGLYIPLSYTVFAALALAARGHTVGGADIDTPPTLNPHIFHVANVGLHTLSVLLVWALLRRIVRSGPGAAVGAALFALHPLQVESVAWVSELRGLLSGALALGCLLAYSSDRRGRYIVATALFVLALLAKPSAVVAPLLVLIVDRLIAVRSWRQYLYELAPWVAIDAGLIFLTRSVQPVSSTVYSALWSRPIVACDALAFYVGKILIPIRLGMDYGRTPSVAIHSPEEWLVCLIPLILAIGAFIIRKRWRWVPAALLVSLSALLPVLGLVPFTYQLFSTVADRYAYLAMLGPAIIVAYGAKSHFWGSILCAMLLVFSVLTFVQCGAWRNDATMAHAMLKVNHEAPFAHIIQGNIYYKDHRPADALKEFEMVIRERPDYSPGYFCASKALNDLGRKNQSIEYLQTALQLESDNAAAYMGLGNSMMENGQAMGALAAYNRAIALDPGLRKVHFNKGSALMKMDDLAAALTEFDAEIRRDRYPSAYVNKGIVLIELKRPAEAIEALQNAISIGPPMVSWYTNLAVAQAMAGRMQDAHASVRKALTLSPGDETAQAVMQMLDRGKH